MNRATAYEAIMTVTSVEDDADVQVSISWNPPLGEKEIEELGYVPFSFKLVESFIEYLHNNPELEYCQYDSLESNTIN